MKNWQIVLTTLLIGLIVAHAQAVDTYWQAGTGNWSTGSNWDNGEPSDSDNAYVNNGGTVQINHQAGEDCNYLYLGENAGQSGNVILSGSGYLNAYREFIGYEGTASFLQLGGTHSIGGYFFLAHSSGSDATYDMYNGTFDTFYLGLAYADGSSGTFNLHNGQVSAYMEAIGFLGTGSFIQTGGTHTVDFELYVGDYHGSNGTYTISAGSLSVPNFYIGHDYTGSRGTLNITGSAASITVSARMDFAGDSTFTAVPGSIIHMTGSIFKNYNTDPSDLAGLSNLELIFEGGSGGVANFEVASEDMGAVIGGWTDNFALGTLTLGGIDVGKIQLRDTFNNQPGIEALYVSNLNIGAGSYLDLNGLNLYYLEGSIDPAATIVYNGGDLIELLPGDFDLDGDVDGVDFGLWQTGYPTASGAALGDGDADGDGDVDGVDFGIWQANYPTNHLGGSAAIPEPATLALLLMGALAILRRPSPN